MSLESGDLLFDGAEVRVAAVIPLDISVDSPVFCIQNFFDDEGVSVRVSLDVMEEPSGKGFGDVIAIDAGGGV